ILAFFLSPLVALLEPYVNQLTQWLTSSALHRKIIKFFIGLVVLGLLVGVSLVAYLSFYWFYIPQRGHVGQVHLQYDNPTGGPSALVDFTRGGRYSQFLRAEQAYNIAVNLHVPASEKNVAIGNFMVAVNLQRADGTNVMVSSRPAILTYQSLPLRLMRTAWKAVPLVLEWSKEDQVLRIPLIEHYVEDASNPVARAWISISTPDLQVYRSTIHIDAHFHGLRYFMYYYKFSTALVFMLVFIFWELVFTVVTWQVLSGWFGSDADALTMAHRIGQADSHGLLSSQQHQLTHQQQQHHQLRAPTYEEGSSNATTTTSRGQLPSTTFSSGTTALPPRQPQLQNLGQNLGGDSDSDFEEDQEGLLPVGSSRRGGGRGFDHDEVDDDDDDDDDNDNAALGGGQRGGTSRGRLSSGFNDGDNDDEDEEDDGVVPDRPLTPSQQRRYAGVGGTITTPQRSSGTRSGRDSDRQQQRPTTTATTSRVPQRQTIVETDDGASTTGSTTTMATTTTTGSSRLGGSGSGGRSGLDISMTSPRGSHPPPPPPSLISDQSSQHGAGVGSGQSRLRRTAVESDFTEEEEYLNEDVSFGEEDVPEPGQLGHRSSSGGGPRRTSRHTTTSTG
ncbi:hypothetical protein BGZ65_008822, partial [Modicella reniformis]